MLWFLERCVCLCGYVVAFLCCGGSYGNVVTLLCGGGDSYGSVVVLKEYGGSQGNVVVSFMMWWLKCKCCGSYGYTVWWLKEQCHEMVVEVRPWSGRLGLN
jgi:hypothetical protein